MSFSQLDSRFCELLGEDKGKAEKRKNQFSNIHVIRLLCIEELEVSPSFPMARLEPTKMTANPERTCKFSTTAFRSCAQSLGYFLQTTCDTVGQLMKLMLTDL